MNFGYFITRRGSTECAVPNRLSESSCYRVAVLEVARKGTNPWVQLQALYIETRSKPKAGWRDKIRQGSVVANLSIHWPHSRVLGISIPINGGHSLRAISPSITPLIVSGKGNSLAIMIDKKARALVLADAQ